MVLEPLTPQERARHERGIERIRQRLFRRYQLSDYFIVPDSEKVLLASAQSCWNAACGSYRVFRFGGLSYEVDCGAEDGRSKFTVLHCQADQFSFWMTGGRRYTISSLTVSFDALDEIVHARLSSYRRANIERVRGHDADTIEF